jgi:hypothetical protein
LEDLLDSGKANFEMDLPAGVRIFKNYDQLSIELARPKKPAKFEPIKIQIPGQIKINLTDEIELELKAELANYERFKKEGQKESRRESIFNLKSEQVFLNLDNISGSLRLRSPLPGDRIQPLGMKGRKKLKEIGQTYEFQYALLSRYPELFSEFDKIYKVRKDILNAIPDLEPYAEGDAMGFFSVK